MLNLKSKERKGNQDEYELFNLNTVSFKYISNYWFNMRWFSG